MDNHDVTWSASLADRVAQIQDESATALRRLRIAKIIRDPRALRMLVSRWNTTAAHCARSESRPQIMARDPERIDAALIELRATAVLVPQAACPRIHRVLAELEGIALRTRSFRRQCIVAQQHTPVGA